MKTTRIHYKPRGNLRTVVTTACTPEAIVDAVKRINHRTRMADLYTRETREYAKQRAKVSLPLALSEWLRKEV